METLLVYKDGSSNKFWKIQTDHTTFTITYGKIGTSGAVKTKGFESEEECRKEAEKLIKAKMKKGYLPAEKKEGIMKESSMTEHAFWNLLQTAKRKEADSEEQIEVLTYALLKMPNKDLVRFDYILQKFMNESYSSNLWAAAYIIMGGCSDDCFDYFRAWLIFQGKETYEAAISNPEVLIPLLEKREEEGEFPQLEELLSAACMAFEEKTGRDDEDYYELFDKLEGFEAQPEIELDWEEDDEKELQNRFPKLWEKYGEVPMEW
ncbi:DUF4240 domain-containing protein [Peribacillus frigoritolerans]|uniref:DUF4240 domain-containing protein n=1 Tax=Peribacillus frigoritolerans TaxID=450367 RepID=UPI0010592C6A|nr:DUF4240 domain-containing protein [Peribacillus frigoritolerans]TDL80556.1 DUF4240 domain-containing protein [Peribacillus frigoritolerans]